MSNRENHDWLSTFIGYTKHGEAPTRMYFWVGIGAIAGALRRRVWVDQAYFKWYPNLYTILVAPPGVIAKSTTADLGFEILRDVPGVVFGPDVTSWQALFDAFMRVQEAMLYEGHTYDMSALTIVASELGVFLRPDDTWMVDQLVNIWDGKPIKKATRMDGEHTVANPCLNFIGCTTPSWIAQHFPDYMIGGGFTSRLLFVYADEKSKYVAYPYKHVPKDYLLCRDSLIRDLERISQLAGPITLTTAAEDWGTAWYEKWHKVDSKTLDETLLGGYINRKQTLVHKIAMCLVASRGDDLIIDQPDLERAVSLIGELEEDMPKVYSRIGMTLEANVAQKALAFIQREGGRVAYGTIFRYMHKLIPDESKFHDVMEGLYRAGFVNTIPDLSTGNVYFEIPHEQQSPRPPSRL